MTKNNHNTILINNQVEVNPIINSDQSIPGLSSELINDTGSNRAITIP